MPPRGRHGLRALAGAVLALVAPAAAVAADDPPPAQTPAQTLGRPIAAIMEVPLRDHAGGAVRLGQRVLAGRPTLISVWASWCPPCMAEAPFLDHLRKQFAPGAFNFIYINRRAGEPDPDQPPADIARFLAHGGLSDVDWLIADVPAYQRLIGADRAQVPEGKVGIPRVYLFDAQGREIYSEYGFDDQSAATLRARLAGAIRH